MKHSKIGASSYKRWKKCPASVRLSEGIPNTTSAYAQEGTRAHAAAEYRLIHKSWPKDVSDEMREAAQIYVDEIENRIKVLQIKKVKYFFELEKRLNLASLHPGLFGTADCIIYDPSELKLSVIDYKHGAGVAVEVEQNEQLMYYGLLALANISEERKNLIVDKVELVIVQPRCPHPNGPVRRWECDAIDLIDFQEDLLADAKRTEDPNAPVVPEDPEKGEDHCRFCPASPVCPAKHQNAIALAKEEFRAELSYNPETLSKALHFVPTLKAWIKSVEEFSEREASQGRIPPGFKQVQKRGSRRWKDEAQAVKFLKTGGFCLTDKDIFTREFKSPAQIEKLLGKEGKKKLEEHVLMESSGLKLVPDSDPTPAFISDPFNDFKDLAEPIDPLS